MAGRRGQEPEARRLLKVRRAHFSSYSSSPTWEPGTGLPKQDRPWTRLIQESTAGLFMKGIARNASATTN